MIRTLSNVLFSIEYAVKSIAGTRCLSWITLSTQSGFCDITSGLLNLIYPSFNPVQQKKMFVLSQAWVRWRAACAPSVASSSSPVRSHSWSPPSPCFTRSASTGNQKYKYKYKYKWKNTNQTHGRHILHALQEAQVQAGTSRYQSSSGRMLLRNQIIARRMQALGSNRTAKEEIIFNLATSGGISGVDLPLL